LIPRSSNYILQYLTSKSTFFSIILSKNIIPSMLIRKLARYRVTGIARKVKFGIIKFYRHMKPLILQTSGHGRFYLRKKWFI
jgi:hypothetical protein